MNPDPFQLNTRYSEKYRRNPIDKTRAHNNTHTVDEDTPVIAIGSEKDQERVDKKDGIDGQVEAQPPLVNEAEITSADAQMKWNVQYVVYDH